jgi:hypothetical protein
MPQYDLHVLCPRCGDFHEMLLRVSLEESFDVRNLGDIYKDKVPPELYVVVSGEKCPITGEPFGQLRPDQMVFVVVGGCLPKN